MASEGITTDFGELRNDTKFIGAVNNFETQLNKIEESINEAVELKDFEELGAQEQVKLDNYLAYSINSLYWMYLKLRGQDTNEHDVKNELSRVRQTMLRDKHLHERNTLRPVIDKPAAKRFIQHGLHKRFPDDDDANESADN